MEQPWAEKRKKTRQIKSTVTTTTTTAKATDSSYGSMKTGTSSGSSLSLSLFSESDLAEAPSTSGCSSEMATATQSKERKKEKAKEFMKKLKSLLPMKERMGKMDTLATLEQVVNSMRQLNEDQRRDQEFKMPAPYPGSYQTVVADKLSQTNMYIMVSPKNHVVHSASPALMTYLGYPSDWWKGRLFKDFLNKKDINTVNSCLALHSTDEESSVHADTSAIPSVSTPSGKETSKYLYARLRRFRKLTDGFNLQNVVSYCPFAMTISTSKPSTDTELEEEAEKLRKSLTIYCHPLSTAFSDGKTLPEETKFSMRHSPCCKFTYVHPNAVRLLGYLPQDYTDMSIFELYHPDDLHQLLDIHKKITVSMGQPFKSKSIRFKTRNGCYVEVDTEWSSFVNPWSMKLEFIIGQHTVIKGPSRQDVFEDIPLKTEKPEVSPEVRKIQEIILEVLKKPIQDIYAEPAVLAPTMEKAAPTQISSPASSMAPAPREAGDIAAKAVTETPKVRFQVQGEVPSAKTKSTVIDDKGISSIYNQLNYSHNIKRFLMSHPKSFSNVSDEDSMMTRDDCEDDAMNEEEEMPLEIPVVKPPSCGSSTQVHVSEQGHGEDMLSPPTFGDETMPAQESADNIHSLTEESLKKHTKIQERLYLQRISEEQPLLFNTRKIKNSRGSSHQKRPRPAGTDEEMETAKHPCTNGGIFRSSSNIFMQNFPAITSSETKNITTNTGEIFCQSDLVQPQASSIGIFPTGYQTANQSALPMPPQPITLVPGDSVGLSYIPTSLGTVVPGQRLVNVGPVRQPQNIQWPFYPQSGYTLLPQVMAGFYRPLLQPVQVQPVAPQQSVFVPSATSNVMLPQGLPSPASPRAINKGVKAGQAEKNRIESDNPSSSLEDTNSSIMYLLEADSSINEDSDTKGPHLIPQPSRIQKKRTLEPPWLRGVKWNTEIKMRYQMPEHNLYPTLKMDSKVLKKSQQSDLVQASLIQLLEDISLPQHEDPLDEDADYLFFPGDETLEGKDTLMKNDFEEVDVTSSIMEDDDGGGYAEDDGGERTVLLELGLMDQDNDNFDTPVNSCSEDEQGNTTPTLTDVSKGEMATANSPEVENVEKEKTTYMDVVDMASVYIPDQPQPEENNIAKMGSSQKDGSLSSDDASTGEELSASDNGQKQETEDSQSNCSKVSSNLTPSDDRSNEEAGSSHKESDTSSKHIQGMPSTASSNSSNEHSGPEEGSPNALQAQDFMEIFRKLFVPLKVQVSQKLDMPGMPYWLLEAHLSERVAMTYKVPTRVLEDVLSEDKRRMEDLVQSNTVKQQLLQLLSEVDQHSPNLPLVSSSSSSSIMPGCPASYRAVPGTRQQVPPVSLPQQDCGAMSMPTFAKSDDPMGVASSSKPVMMSGITTTVKIDSEDQGIAGLVPASSNSGENLHLFHMGSSSVSVCRETAGQSCLKGESTPKHDYHASDTNSDPMVGNSVTQSSSSSSQSRGSSDITIQQKRSARIPAAMPKTADMFFQDWCQAVASGVTGQTVEDIVMAKVFVSSDNTPNSNMKTASNIFGLLE